MENFRHFFRRFVLAVFEPVFDDIDAAAYEEEVDIFRGFLIHLIVGDPVIENELLGDEHAFFMKVDVAVFA